MLLLGVIKLLHLKNSILLKSRLQPEIVPFNWTNVLFYIHSET